MSSFQAGSTPGPHHGKRRCHLILIADRMVNHAGDFRKIAEHIREYDPKVTITVVDDRRRAMLDMMMKLALPAFAVSLVPTARMRPLRGPFMHGQNLSKSQEYERLEAAGFAVPNWQLIKADEELDSAEYGPYVVTKPDRGARGALVKIKKTARVRYKAPGKSTAANLTPGKYGAQVLDESEMLAQKFIYTGQWAINYRVTTLFGQVLHTQKTEASRERKALVAPDALAGVGSIVASGKGCVITLNTDEEIIRFGEAAASAFPDIPLLGFDIVREVPSGKLFILEANAVGYVWNFSTPMGQSIQRDNNFNLESQFDGLRKAARILADKTQELAC